MAEKKKVLFVIMSLDCGGAEKSLVSLLSLFDFDKYDVSLQMFRDSGMFRSLLPDKVKVLPPFEYAEFCRKGGFRPRYMIRRAYVAAGIRWNKLTHKNKYHSAQVYWKYAGGAYPAAADPYDVAIAWGQGNPTHYVASKVHAGVKLAIINIDYRAAGYNPDFDRPYYQAIDHIAGVSGRLYDSLVNVFPDMKEKLIVLWDIRNQSLIERMADLPESDFVRAEDGFTLTTVGRMTRQKGYDIAVGAAAILKRHGRRFRWYLVGDGTEHPAIREQIEREGLADCVIDVGARPNPYPFVKGADIYVQTSRFEGFCLTLAEARILGVPPVSTCFDVVYDQLRSGENGLIADMTPEAVAAGIERLMDDPALYASVRDTLRREHIGNEDEILKLYRLMGE